MQHAGVTFDPKPSNQLLANHCTTQRLKKESGFQKFDKSCTAYAYLVSLDISADPETSRVKVQLTVINRVKVHANSTGRL
jgi:hypothetical protein